MFLFSFFETGVLYIAIAVLEFSTIDQADLEFREFLREKSLNSFPKNKIN